MNEGIYNGTQILEKDTVDLMHEIPSDNDIGYGLAWMRTIISPHITATGHGGDLPGADTYMLYNQTEDIGIIYFANGNPYYSLLPFKGLLSVQYLMYSLFTKQAAVTGKTHKHLIITPDPWFIRFLMEPHPLLS
jgi:CubicO group peptidase (beta-lactamase class C family)